MAATTGVQIRILSNRLPQLSAALESAVAAEVQKAAFQIEAEAKRRVPVKTGTLRRSIHSVFEQGGRLARVGPSVLYGRWVEFGTRRRAARPYLRPAAELVAPKFRAAIAAAVKRAAG